LGNVENGWFAQLAHAVQAAGRTTLNFVSCGNHWGDRFYSSMDAAANHYIARVNDQAISQALANGATQHQALSAANAVLETKANPKTLKELASLACDGTSIAGQTVKGVATPVYVPMDFLGMLTPILIGAGVLGGIYLLADAFSGSPASSRR